MSATILHVKGDKDAVAKSEGWPLVEPGADLFKSVSLTGNTFPHREAIKRMGGRWDKAGRAWVLSDSQAEKHAEAIGRLGGVKAEGSGSFAPGGKGAAKEPPRPASAEQMERLRGVTSKIPGYEKFVESLATPLTEKDASEMIFNFGKLLNGIGRSEEAEEKAKEQYAKDEKRGIKRHSVGSGYVRGRGHPHEEGDVYRDKKTGEVRHVIEASKQYVREDGMSVGVGDESGHIYHWASRPATAAEQEDFVQIEQIDKRLREANEDLRSTMDHAARVGTRPENADVKGDVLVDTFNAYGGGERLVAGSDGALWYVKNNGADGDNWGANNVRTGGAGAIGWRVEVDAATMAAVRDAARVVKTRGDHAPSSRVGPIAEQKQEGQATRAPEAEPKPADQTTQETPMEHKTGSHVIADGEHAAYMKPAHGDLHYVHTGKGVKAVAADKIKHPEKGAEPPKHVVEGFHAHPVAKHKAVIEVGPRGGRRTGWYYSHGVKKYLYEGQEGGTPAPKAKEPEEHQGGKLIQFRGKQGTVTQAPTPAPAPEAKPEAPKPAAPKAETPEQAETRRLYAEGVLFKDETLGLELINQGAAYDGFRMIPQAWARAKRFPRKKDAEDFAVSIGWPKNAAVKIRNRFTEAWALADGMNRMLTRESADALQRQQEQANAKPEAPKPTREDLSHVTETEAKLPPGIKKAKIESFDQVTKRTGKTPSRNALGARNCKRELEAAYPGINFKVSSDTYSMGSSIAASWTDGPTEKEADEIVDRYQMVDFDGMTDSETHRDNAHGDKYGGAHYARASREWSKDTRDKLTAWAKGVIAEGNGRDRYDAGSLAHQLFAKTSFAPGAEVDSVVERPLSEIQSGQLVDFYRVRFKGEKDTPTPPKKDTGADADAEPEPAPAKGLPEEKAKAIQRAAENIEDKARHGAAAKPDAARAWSRVAEMHREAGDEVSAKRADQRADAVAKEFKVGKYLEDKPAAPLADAVRQGLEAAGPKPEEPKPQRKAPDLPEELSDPLAADIPLSTATTAHSGTSWSPDKRGEQVVAEYVRHLRDFRKTLDRYAKTPEQKAEADKQFDDYRRLYRKHTLAVLGSRSGIMSTMITGGSNFPVRRMQKKSAAYDKRVDEMSAATGRAWERGVKAVRTMAADGGGVPISSDDNDAVTKLKARVAGLEQTHERNKAINKIARGKGTDADKIARMVALGVSEGTARAHMQPDQFTGKPGVPAYSMTNAGANIKRLKERVEQLEKQRGQETTEKEVAGVRLVDDVDDNRMRLHFDGKPAAHIIKELKANGFKWSPTNGAWQRFRSNAATYHAERIAKMAGGEETSKAILLHVSANGAPPIGHPVTVEPPKRLRHPYPFEGYIDFQGIEIDVENVQGSTRRGKDADGHEWATYMHAHYGEIRKTKGVDKDALDVYVGPDHDAPLCVVIHQHDPVTGAYDEDKVMLGFATEEDAINLYLRQYDRPGYYVPGDYEAMPIGAFWRWVHDRSKREQRVAPGAAGAQQGKGT